MKFLKIRKIKKLQKVTFAFLHTCTAFLPVLGGPNRKSAKSCTFCTLALPNRPSRTFSYVYDVFARSGSPKSTFYAFGAKKVVMSIMGRPRAPRANGPDPPSGSLTEVRGGRGRGFPPISLSHSPSICKNSTTANLKVLLWCQNIRGGAELPRMLGPKAGVEWRSYR